MSSEKSKKACDHTKLGFSPQYAQEVGYIRPTLAQRFAATTPQGIVKNVPSEMKYVEGGIESQATFPAPLVLPGDELTFDPRCPPQSFRAWTREKNRNKVTPEQNTIYVAAAPDIHPDITFVSKWTQPRRKALHSKLTQPKLEDVVAYLSAFYHGLPVKPLPSRLCFTPEIDSFPEAATQSTTAGRRIIGLDTRTTGGCIGIRARETPRGVFTHQLNLNDLLDAAIVSLPEDAYTLIMLVEHDIYEDEDDDFACGRAYGGSRIACVSTARYNPALDREQGIEREHSWPASHCQAYLQTCCDSSEKGTGRKEKSSRRKVDYETHVIDLTGELSDISPMQAAISAHSALPSFESSSSASAVYGLWLGRVCRTSSHELGHCFGMDHCVYYACAMQATASIIEDARQPPYLCPVDLAKVLRATSTTEKDRYEALLSFCNQHKDTHLFAAFGAWIQGRVLELGKLA